MGPTVSKKLPQIILLGDSLTEWGFDEHTEGFGWYLESWYKGKAEIINKGYASYTSSHIQHEFPRLLSSITAPSAPPTLLLTIFLGANDACFVGKTEYVPLPKFEANIREFVETALTQDALPDTKIVLITPPPINIPDPVGKDDDDEEEEDLDLGPSMAAALAAARPNPKEERGYRTYKSKKRYADKILEIAKEYEETGRVVGLDYWTALVDAGLADQGREGEAEAERYDEDRLPGCGLKTAKKFEAGYFTDGLHLGKRGYQVLSKVLVEKVVGTWPELAPDRLG
ncbi:SGNH hydrolase [Byssothecium circinans]|uniref:SGNH hydrolase n=1 Tax=Byssothecium circinans TaxID=147558 RepID=A0A6A5TTN7_9PLEO|nr:SGNH hydrolase [Byssothecium circinans]